MNHDYARGKLTVLLRDLDRYTADEFWREMSRIAAGASGKPHAEELAAHVEAGSEIVDSWGGYRLSTTDAAHRLSAWREGAPTISRGRRDAELIRWLRTQLSGAYSWTKPAGFWLERQARRLDPGEDTLRRQAEEARS